MSANYIQDGNSLIVGDTKLTLDYNIRFVKEVGTILIVLLEIPHNEIYLNNVLGVSTTGKIIWRIQNARDVAPVKNQLPYENLVVSDNDVTVSDFYGRRFFINPATGEIISSDVVR